MVISGEKAVQQLEELLILMINSFEGVKDVIKFMSFEELEIVGFQTQTALENKPDYNLVGDTIGIGGFDEQHSESNEESKSMEKESVTSDANPEQFKEWCENTRKKREELKDSQKNDEKNDDKFELNSIIELIRNKKKDQADHSNPISPKHDGKLDHDITTPRLSDVFAKFSMTNFVKGRKPKLHKQLNPYPKHEKELNTSKTMEITQKLEEKTLEDLQEIVFPDLEKITLNNVNGEEFLSKYWIEIMEVLYTMVSDIFLRIGNIQVNDEVSRLFTHIQNWSNKNIVKYIYERLFSKHKYSLEQYWFKSKDRIETLEKQKSDLKKEVMEVQELLMAMSNNSQSITSLQPKSRHQSIDGEETNIMPSSRNLDSVFKNNDTAEFGQSKQQKESEDMSETVPHLPNKIPTIRSRPDELALQEIADQKQLLTRDNEIKSPTHQKSSTMRNIENNNTDEKPTSNFNRTISKVSNSKMMTSQSQQNYLRAGKMKMIEQLQLKQELKDKEKENFELQTKIEEITKDSIKWKNIMSRRIVELEDQNLKLSREKEFIREEYARDLVRVSKLTKDREKDLIENIKNSIDAEHTKKLQNLHLQYDQKINATKQKLEETEEKYNEICEKETELRDEYNRIIKQRNIQDFKKN